MLITMIYEDYLEKTVLNYLVDKVKKKVQKNKEIREETT